MWRTSQKRPLILIFNVTGEFISAGKSDVKAMQSKLELYTGPHCELCDTAKELIYASLPVGSYELSLVDVTTSLELKKAYGLRIPVLRHPASGAELEWPFTSGQLLAFC